MVKVTVKGGLWKNAEDEILKAAVMKYGLNDWERICSLLVQKTAAQCKARWFEWLDPSINKTDWSKQEDERLLHLCKVFPSQWRTVSSLIGRTAFQCLERFNILLAAGDSAVQTADVAMAESLPSRPDLARMPQEDVAMIDEARARIANIKGRKDRRKERQRAADSVRQASIVQRNRELQAAGLVKNLPGLNKAESAVPSVPLPKIAESDKVKPMTSAELTAHFKTAEPLKVKDDRKPARRPVAFKVPQASVNLSDILDLPPVIAESARTPSVATNDVASLLAALPASSVHSAPATRKRPPTEPTAAPDAKKPRTDEQLKQDQRANLRDTLPHPGSKKLVNIYREVDATIDREAVALMIKDAVNRPVSIQGRPPGVSDIPTEAAETIDSESLGQARLLIDAECGVLNATDIRTWIRDIYSAESVDEAGRRRLPTVQTTWTQERKKLEKERAALSDKLRPSVQRLTEVQHEVDKMKAAVAELEFQEKILGLRTEEELTRTRELIHQWTDVCEVQRKRKRELVAQIL